MPKIIAALDVTAGQYHEIYKLRKPINMRAVDVPNPNWDSEGAAKRNLMWYVEDDVVEAAVAEISKWHPGVDISVYTLTDIFHRPAGDLTHRIVTKDGVLPS